MTRAHDRPQSTANAIEQKATEWLVKQDKDSSPELSRALDEWLGADPRHRAAFLRISTAWRHADVLRRLADPKEEPNPDLLAPERPPASPPRTFRFAAAAAVLVVLISVAAWLTQRFNASQTYSTSVGEFHRVTLADGSSISLNTNTRVRVSYGTEIRKLELLQGEAHFEVARDAARPFVVHAGDALVQAVGTAFVVRMRDPVNVDVLVSEGRVAINPPAQTLVSSGEIAIVRGTVVERHAIDDLTRRLAWTEGMLIFSGETLSEAVAEFNRYNRRQLVIADHAIAGRTIGGAFKATNPDRFATALEKMFGVEARVHEGTFGSEIRLSSGAP
jgi:transmembrane sensor